MRLPTLVDITDPDLNFMEHVGEPLVVLSLTQCRALVLAAQQAFCQKWPQNTEVASLGPDEELSVSQWFALEALLKSFFASETVEGGFDRVVFGFRVHDEVVLLTVRWVCYVPYAGEEDACYGVL